ncbi:MAG: hypothetical protein A2Z83_05690 [Omnitrophica bacterium GWA2_52_8]|nr:MAG: hypothetical protein A2Z83_05690 [Omnitrophica bacterium GWA2_52_8]
MMPPDSEKTVIYLVLWIFLLAVTVFDAWRKRSDSAGLPLAYLANLTVIHWFGAMIYVLPWYEPYHPMILGIGSRGHVYLGFEQAFFGAAAFTSGVLLMRIMRKPEKTSMPRPAAVLMDMRLPKAYLATAVFFGILIAPTLTKIPSLATISYAANSLMVSAICIYLFHAIRAKKLSRFLFWLLISLVVIPFIILVFQGFLGFGVRIAVIILSLVLCFYRPRWQLVLFAVIGLYLGLSLYVNYMEHRTKLRQSIWGGKSLQSRISETANVVKDFEMLNLHNSDHLTHIDSRLNQNMLVGRGVENIQTGAVKLAHGETFRDSFLAMIPRILWPQKPMMAGSSNLVSRFTQLFFPEGTSVGIGQIMELYVNYGQACVMIGCFVLGIGIAIMDQSAKKYLMMQNWKKFVQWHLPATGLIQVGGSLVDVSATVAAALIFCFLINHVLLGGFRPRKRQPYLFSN